MYVSYVNLHAFIVIFYLRFFIPSDWCAFASVRLESRQACFAMKPRARLVDRVSSGVNRHSTGVRD